MQYYVGHTSTFVPPLLRGDILTTPVPPTSKLTAMPSVPTRRSFGMAQWCVSTLHTVGHELTLELAGR